MIDLTGGVNDQNGDFIIGAQVTLSGGKDFLRETISDHRGRFRFAALSAGLYTLKVSAKGFGPQTRELNLTDSQSAQQVTIALRPTVEEKVLVTGEKPVSLDPDNAVGSQVFKEKDLDALPDDPDQFNEQLQLLATSSGSAPGRATVTVDGFNADGRIPPKSAIREVRINPDLFSAQFDKAPYQGGRIQIFTKPGALSFNGSAFFNYNNSILNARDAFALSRPDVTTRRFGFEFGGPIIKRKVGFLLNMEGRDINESATVNAIVLGSDFRPTPLTANVATPKLLMIGSARVDWQKSQATTLIFRYDINDNHLSNQGVGGFNLAERAYTTDVKEHSLRFSETTILSKQALNEGRIGITRLLNSQQAQSDATTISVLGSFTSGGATTQAQDQKEWLIEVADNVSAVVKKHTLMFGAQVYGKNVEDVRAENFEGTFIFGGRLAPQLDSSGRVETGPNGPIVINISGLEQYRRTLLSLPGGSPNRFLLTSGNLEISASQWRWNVFAQDEWKMRPDLALSLGLRYEGQTAPSDKISLAPRFGVAFSPDKRRHWVLRARAGIFYDRIGESLALENTRLDGQHQEQIIVDSPSFPDPFKGGATSGVIPTLRRAVDNLRPATSLQTQFAVEHELKRGWKVQVSHSWTRGWFSQGSRNINAPVARPGIDPATAPRPLGVEQNILAFQSGGRISGQVLFFGVNQTINKYFNLYSGYLLFDFHSETDNPFMLPQSSYDLKAEWARPIWQSRHRVFVVAIVNCPWRVRGSINLNAASGTPFNITTGRDNNADGVFSDRPSIVDPGDPTAISTRLGVFDASAINGGLPRNAGTNPGTMTLDLNLSRTFKMSAKGSPDKESKESKPKDIQYRLTLNVHASNILNRTNVTGLNGVLTSPFFGRPNSAQPPRRIEVGARFSF